jgi:hypothetical protein
MGNPASFATAASTNDVNTFTAAQTFSAAVTMSSTAAITGALTVTAGITGNTSLTVAPSVLTSGVRTALTVTGAVDTGRTASTEQSDVYFNLGRTVTWATGALTTQRAVRVAAPTLAFVGASTVTTAVTLDIDNAPQQGANATITNAYALRVAAGASRFDAVVVQNAIPRFQSTTDTSASPTVNTPCGVVRVASGGTTVTVTCAACTANTLIRGQIRNNTTNSVSVRSIEPGAGSFVVRLSGDPGVSNADVFVQIAQPGSGT